MTTPNEVLSTGLCIGCGACAVAFPGKVEMSQSATGFMAPAEAIPLSHEEELAFGQFCPGVKVSSPAAGRGRVWGPHVIVVRARATDETLRRTGSSGGALSAVALNSVEDETSSSIVTVRASRSDPLANEAARVTTRDQVLDSAGSRYGPAAPLLAFLEDSQDRPQLFVGKPCDVAAARALAEAGLLRNNRISGYVSFLCAGTPGRGGTVAALESMGLTEGDVISMRYRGNGWPGQMTVETASGVATLDYDTSWGKHLGTDIHTRCKYCADGIGLSADLVFGDAWCTAPDGQPSFQEAPGWSAVIVRTARGTELLGSAHQRGTVVSEPYSLQELSRVQKYQVDRRRLVWSRLLGRQLAGAAVPAYSRGVRRIGWNTAPPVARLRALLGAYRRSKRPTKGLP